MQEGTLLCVNELTHKYPYQFEIFFKENYMKSKKILSAVLASALCIGTAFACVGMTACKGKDKENGGTTNPPGGTTNPPEGGTPEQDTSVKFTGKIYLVGDSTVCDFGSTDKALYIPRYGYGTQIQEYINIDKANVINIALSGRSSYSFTKENNYSQLSNITNGDYLIIGFGHNDEKYEADRYSDPTLSSSDTSTMIGTYDAQRPVSFKYILKHYYIDLAVSKGATPILCTPIVRLASDSAKYDSDHITESKTNYTDSTNKNITTDWNGGNYAQAIRDLATEQNLTLADLTTLTKNDYKAIGYDEAIKYHSIKGGKWSDESKSSIVPDLASYDGTHTNLFGAKMNSYYIADAIKSTTLPLSASVKTNAKKPTYAENATAMVNPDYEVPSQEPFNPDTDKSSKWAVNGSTKDANSEKVYNWYGTAFGANLGITNIATTSQYSITQGTDEDGVTFTVNADAGKGKIQSGDDSLVGIFIQIPFATAFTVTADVTLETFGSSNNQSGFGMMLRDDIMVDSLNTAKSNYVNTGCIVTNKGADANVYSGRLNGTLFTSGVKDSGITTGTKYSLSIARTSQSVVATFNDKAPYSAVKDFDLGASDNKYVYVCLWVVRGTKASFSNITFASGEWVNA